MRELPSVEELRLALSYDAETGILTRRVFVGGRYGGLPGSVAGTKNEQGYVIVSHRCQRYRAHRIAWALVTGEWPSCEIDHINGIRDDNRWANLRDVASAINAQNKRRAQRNSKTGLLGASWSKREKAFVSRIKINGVYRYLGAFATAESAHAAYLLAKRTNHPGCTI